MHPFKKGLMGLVIGFGAIAVIKDYACFLYSETASMPYRYFLNLKKIKPQKGDYTCLDSPWYGQKIIKEIVGQEGDQIFYDTEGNLWIGPKKIGKPKRKTKDGRHLHSLQAGAIPKGFVFVTGHHDHSFDSRYQELGLVPLCNLQGRVTGLL